MPDNYIYIGDPSSGGGGSGFTAGGDLTGTSTNQTVSKLQGVALDTSSPQDGYALVYSGAGTKINFKQVSGAVPTGTGFVHVTAGSQDTAAKLVADADVSGTAAIAYSKLALTNSIVNADVSSSAAIAYSKLNLGSSIVNADVSGTAAIAYSKLNLASSIVNSDVSSSAAIAGTKISPDFGSQTIKTTGNVSLGSGTLAAAGLIRLPNNAGVFSALRNAGNTADLVFSAVNTTDGYLGSDSSKANNLTNVHVAPSTATNLFAGSTRIAAFTSSGLQMGATNSFGSGVGVIGIANAGTNPSTNPSGGIVAYVDSADGYLKYRKADGTVINLNGASTPLSISGTGLVKVVSGTIQSAAALLVDADVSSSAAIAGTKISPDFGSQTIKTTGNISLGSGTFASSGLERYANNPGTISAQRNSGNTADLVILSANTTDGYIGSDTSKATNLSNVHISPSTSTNINVGSTNVASFTSSLLTSVQPIAIGTSVASTGSVRLPNTGSIYYRNAANSGDLPAITTTSGNVLAVGNNTTVPTTQLMGANTLSLIAGGFEIDFSGSGTWNWGSSPPAQLLGGTNAAAGLMRLGNNMGTVLAQRNSGNTADMVLLAANTTDGYLGCDTSYASALTNLTLGASTVVLKNTSTKQLATTTTDMIDVAARVQTTSATITDLYTWTLDTNAVTTVDVRVTACQSTTGTADAWTGQITFKNAAGTVTVVQAATTIQRGSSAWSITLDNSTTTARLRVTGAASTQIEWGAKISRQVTRQS